jgi:hypothetical protein
MGIKLKMKKITDRDLRYTLNNFYTDEYNPRFHAAADEIMRMAAKRIDELRREKTKIFHEKQKLRDRLISANRANY